MNILITGGKGYIARAIKSIYPNATFISREDFDLTSQEQTKKWFKNKFYDVVIHTAVEGGSRLKIDNSEILDNNIKMYYNLLNHKDQYKKFIHLGSGADTYSTETAYGTSKKTISASILDKTNFFDLRIFAVFDENELDSRFIKANIKRRLINEALIVHQNKAMDFIYMPDFLKILQAYINDNNLPKKYDCVYNKKYTLIDLCNIICSIEPNKPANTKIEISTSSFQYTGKFVDIGIKYIGLHQGIKEVYLKLKEIHDEKNMVCS